MSISVRPYLDLHVLNHVPVILTELPNYCEQRRLTVRE